MAVHESARDLYEIGAISEDEMKEFDKGCLCEPVTKFETEKIFEPKHVTA